MVNYNSKGDIICEVCGKAFASITPSHLNSHNMTVRQYRKKYLVHENQPLRATYFSTKRIRKIKL